VAQSVTNRFTEREVLGSTPIIKKELSKLELNSNLLKVKFIRSLIASFGKILITSLKNLIKKPSKTSETFDYFH